jgi:hypothetical protein
MADGLEVLDQPTDELVDLPAVDGPDPDPEPQDANPDPEPQDKVDGRKFNSEWSKALKELRELYPDKADMLTKLRDTYGRFQAYQELAPKGLDEVRQWKSTLDAIGGSEAAAELMQRVAQVEQIDSRIQSGDFSVVNDFTPEMQKGFYQMLPEALTHLSQTDEKSFAAAVMPHFAAALEGTGMGDHLKKMYAAAGDNEALKDLIKQQYDWYQQQVQGKGQMPGAQKTVSPEVQRLQAELETRRAADDQAFVSGVYLKQLNLTEAQKADLQESAGSKLADKLGADTAFNKQLAAYKALKNRNPETVNAYIRSKIDEHYKGILDGLVTARYGGMRQKAKPATQTAVTTDGGATRVAKIPDRSEWDEDKMIAAGYDSTAKIGKFFLKGNRTVQLVKQ